MNTQIILRKYRKEDESSLTSIIREAWHYDELCTPNTAAKLANVFLYSCLANQTYTQVAEIDGKAAGVIMAKDISVRVRVTGILSDTIFVTGML